MAAAARLSCSDDEDAAPLSAKLADIYPLSNCGDAEAAANTNGIHSELNGGVSGGEDTAALKAEVGPWHLVGQRGHWWRPAGSALCPVCFQTPQGSSTSASSSEADEEEVDGGSGGAPPAAPQEAAVALDNGRPEEEDRKADSPPPSYPAQQVGFHFFTFSVLPKVSFSVSVFSEPEH